MIQGVFFNWDPPKNHKYGKKLKHLNWDSPKNHKYGKKLKYPNWDPPKMKKKQRESCLFSECNRLPHHGAAIISGTEYASGVNTNHAVSNSDVASPEKRLQFKCVFHT